jgi:small subunit ribosomal protein S2
VSLIDTDSDPDTVDLAIPGNDDSIRSIELVLAKLADAILEGKAALPAPQTPAPTPKPWPPAPGPSPAKPAPAAAAVAN